MTAQKYYVNKVIYKYFIQKNYKKNLKLKYCYENTINLPLFPSKIIAIRMSQKIVELVNLWARYEAERPDLSIEDFCVQVLAERAQAAIHDEKVFDYAWTAEELLNGRLGRMLGRLAKYVNIYSKKAFADADLNNVEDVVYLGVLQMMGNPRKTDLINAMLSEFPSGIDIIKRLLRLELVTETPDLEDKRSKRLHLTDKGRLCLHDSFPLINRVSEMAFTTLNTAEKMLLLQLLGRLEDFHDQRYRDVRNADFATTRQLLQNHNA